MKLAYAFGGALAVAAGFGYADEFRKPVVSPEQSAARAAVAQHDPPDDGTRVSGRVLEAIDVEKYTYLRLAASRGETWAAVSRAAVPIGSSVTVEHAARMDHFVSKTLKRTFDVIYFGELPATGSAAGGGEQDPGIPEALLEIPGGTLPAGHPDIGGPEAAMMVDGDQPMPVGHPGATQISAAIAVPKLARAPGPDGYVIADVFAKKAQLAGKRVRIRGMVTKVTLDVLGQTFLHIRDGSGDDAAKTNDLAVTTKERPGSGDVLLFDGVLRVDADLGIGYRYPALLENAVIVKE